MRLCTHNVYNLLPSNLRVLSRSFYCKEQSIIPLFSGFVNTLISYLLPTNIGKHKNRSHGLERVFTLSRAAWQRNGSILHSWLPFYRRPTDWIPLCRGFASALARTVGLDGRVLDGRDTRPIRVVVDRMTPTDAEQKSRLGPTTETHVVAARHRRNRTTDTTI